MGFRDLSVFVPRFGGLGSLLSISLVDWVCAVREPQRARGSTEAGGEALEEVIADSLLIDLYPRPMLLPFCPLHSKKCGVGRSAARLPGDDPGKVREKIFLDRTLPAGAVLPGCCARVSIAFADRSTSFDRVAVMVRGRFGARARGYRSLCSHIPEFLPR